MGCIKEADSSDHNATQESNTNLNQNNQDETGDPVNIVTGAFVLTETDISFPSQRLVINFTRHYNNQHHDVNDLPSPLGFGWTHSLNLYLESGPCPFQITYVDDRGTKISFSFEAAGQIELGSGEYKLTSTEDGNYQIYRKNKPLGIFDSEGNPAGTNSEKIKRTLKAGQDFKKILYIEDDQISAVFEIPASALSLKPPSGALGMKMVFLDGNKISLRQMDGLTAVFGADGKIETLIRPGVHNDSRIDFIYNENRKLCKLQGAGSRSLEFYYSGELIESIKDHTGREWNYHYNENKELVEVRDPLQRIRRYEYRGWEGQVSIGKGKTELRKIRALEKIYPYSDKTGRKSAPELTLKYTSDRRVFSQTDALGNCTKFSYNRFTRITSVTDPLGRTTIYGFDQNGNTTKIRKPRGGTTEYIYDNRGNLLAEIDQYENRREYVDFKDPKRIDEKKVYGRRALGNRSAYVTLTDEELQLGYDNFGNRPLVRDSLGNTTRFLGYTEFGRPQKVILPDRNELTYEYDRRCGLPIRMERELKIGRDRSINFQLEWTYDAIGNLIRYIEQEKTGKTQNRSVKVTEYEYDVLGQPLVRREWYEENGRGRDFAAETHYSWDDLGRLADKTEFQRDAPGGEPKLLKTKFIYDLLSRETRQIDPENIIHDRCYDLAGRLIETYLLPDIKPAASQIVPLQARIDRRCWEYDAVGNQVRIINPDGTSSIIKRDACGQKETLIDSLGMATKYEYDEDGNNISEAFPGGYKITFDYDLADRLVKQKDNLGREIIRTYDPVGRLFTLTNNSNHQNKAVTTYHYDSTGNLIGVDFPDGTCTTIIVDERGKAVKRLRGDKTNPAISEETFKYDIFEHQTSISIGNAEQEKKQFTISYNDQQREIEVKDALGNRSSTFYNSSARPIRKINAEGKELFLEYDGRMRLCRRSSEDRLVESIYQYDCLDRITKADEASISYRWEYDVNGQVVRYDQSIGDNTESINYKYDAGGRLLQKNNSDDNWRVHVGYENNTPAPAYVEILGLRINLDTDLYGRVIEEAWPDGWKTNYLYDTDGATASIENRDKESRLVYKQQFERDLRGRPKSELRFRNGTSTKYHYKFDQLNRLTTIGVEKDRRNYQEFTRYVYDDRGNRVEEYREGNLFRTYIYDDANRLIEQKNGLGENVEINSYDRCGNLIKQGELTFSYDQNQRMREIFNQKSALAEYHYSATDQRAVIKRPDSYEQIYYDGAQEILTKGSNSQSACFWGLNRDVLFAFHASGEVNRVLTDSIGSVIGLNTGGSIVDYEPFGDSVSGPPLPFGYCSKRFDPVSGFYHNRAREYDPVRGRFSQPDPSGFADGANLYIYAQNNPLVYTDPTGWKAVRESQGSLGKFDSAWQYGIQSYSELHSELQGTGLQAHHLIEQRFADTIGMDPGSMASIALTPSEHSQFTSAWREAIGYISQNNGINTATAVRDEIWATAQQIYSGYHELLAAAYKDVYH
jgi:RHS repeat-associated protein